jgi:pyrroloquinoline-quinone synthase
MTLIMPPSFQERLLRVMDRKDHFAYWKLMGAHATKAQLKNHYLQEWGVYVRDFPLFLARILAMNPPADVRSDLAENLFEEETGKLTLGVSHPELFLRMMEGLGFKRGDFAKARLIPEAMRYRKWLDRVTTGKDWLIAMAVVTVFVEGSRKDRGEVEETKLPEPPVEDALSRHPLVIHHGLNRKFLDLQRAHSQAESGHRAAAWKAVLGYAKTKAQRDKVELALKTSLNLWLKYRDGVGKLCGLKS